MKTTRTLTAVALAAATLALAGCSAAEVSTQNAKTAADNFEVDRRIAAINTISNQEMFVIEGKCSLAVDSAASQPQLEVICRVGEGDDMFVRNIIGLSDNVSYVAQQIDPIKADPFRYRYIIRPETIIPDAEVSTSAGTLGAN